MLFDYPKITIAHCSNSMIAFLAAIAVQSFHSRIFSEIPIFVAAWFIFSCLILLSISNDLTYKKIMDPASSHMRSIVHQFSNKVNGFRSGKDVENDVNRRDNLGQTARGIGAPRISDVESGV